VAAAAAFALLVTADLFATRAGRGAVEAGTRPAADAAIRVTIASPVARKLYDEGLGRYYAGDAREGLRLLRAALAEDSSCAMCAYFASLAAEGSDDTLSTHMVRLALRLSNGVSESERMLIRYAWASVTNSPTRLAVAGSLATRYPDWPPAQLAMGEALSMAGDFLGAATHLRRAIAQEPVRSRGPSRACPACQTEVLLTRAYEAADSLPAALRVARAWVRSSAHSRGAWLMLAHTLAESGRYDEARAALDTSTSYAASMSDDVLEHAEIEIRAGNFALADLLLRALVQTGNPSSRRDALWWLAISLRQQGRFREALDLARGPMRAEEADSTSVPRDAPVAEAQALFELRRYRQAAAIFASMADVGKPSSPSAQGAIARRRAWYLTHAGSALAAAGDTAALAALADTVEAWGRRSGFARDAHLHQYLRGLLWMGRRQPDKAVAAFRQAMTSETQTFSRIDLELARALLALHRPAQAIPVLRHSLAGSIEGGNFYATRTELQELLAAAYDAADQPDSAAAYYGQVIRAWRRADPQLLDRVARARARLALERRLGRPTASAAGGR
jgi:tetratricopeptide (TPR) repeat protein